MHNARVDWQEGAFKRSNEQLYEILEGCHKLLVQLRASTKLRKKLNDALEAGGFTVRSNTSLEVKVVRAVFGEENNRTFAYARVLQLAKNELPKGWTLTEWIEDQGGVEEVRRKPKNGPSAADKAKLHRAKAEAVLADADAIGPRFKPSDSLQPLEDGDYDFSVALVRVDKDGKAAIVFGCNNNALVKAVLTEAGKQIADQEEQEEPASKHTTKRNRRDEILNADYDEFDLEAALAA